MVDACYTIVDFGGHHGGNRLSAGIKNFQGQLIIFAKRRITTLFYSEDF